MEGCGPQDRSVTSVAPPPRGGAQGPERSSRRDAVHLAGLVVPWMVVGWLWWRVAQTATPGQLTLAVVLVLAVAAISLPLNFAWVVHNVRIFRRRGPRTGLTAPQGEYHVDWAQRPVTADWPAIRASAVVIVSPTAERKVFAPGETVGQAAPPLAR